jgi:hypothetical protein
MKTTTIATMTASMILGLSAAAQNLIRNGSFESPVIASNSYQAITPTDWFAAGAADAFLHNGDSGDPSVWPLPQDGQQFGNTANAASAYSLSQTFTVTNPGIHVLRWYDSSGHSGGFTTSPYSVAILGGGSQIVVSNNFDAYHATFGAWEVRSNQVFLASGTYTLRFLAGGVFHGLDSLIDNVSLEQLPSDDLLASIHCSAVDICWAGRTNQLYQVQYSTNVSDTNWFDFGSPVLGTGTNCVTDGINGMEHRFYRIIRVP